jgi:hypothetical protein
MDLLRPVALFGLTFGSASLTLDALDVLGYGKRLLST